MITIDDVVNIKAHSNPAFEPRLGIVCDLAIAQHEEIERLRKLRIVDVTEFGYVVLKITVGELLSRERDEAYERAAQVCDARQNYEPECPETAAYCADAIRSLKSGEPK